MSRKRLTALLVLAGLAVSAGACAKTESHTDDHAAAGHAEKTSKPARSTQPTQRVEKPVPAFQSPASAKNLKPTLPPEMFQGQVRAAYAVVREIPETIAQLPCYCRCDRSAGHKSLYSCFLDEHGANCGICMNSALKAHKLQKEKKMTPEQIRAELITEYAGH